MKRLLQIFSIFICVLFLAQNAAAAVKNYIIMPFDVNAPAEYKPEDLEKSIPQMFASRLHWPDNVELSPNEEMVPDKVPANNAEVRQLLEATKADYAVWGNLTVLGADASVDAKVMDRAGKVWPISRQSKVNVLIPSISAICDNISAEVFKRPVASGAVAARPEGQAQAQAYMNPSIRYQGGSASDNTRLRSQQLKFQAYGMEVVDADLDGRNEVFLFDDFNIYAYRYENGRMRQLTSARVNLTQHNVSIRSFLFAPGERPKILLTSIDSENMPRARVYDFDGKKLSVEINDIRYFLSVIKNLDTRGDILIGQPGHSHEMFKKKAITEMLRNGDTLTPGSRLTLPEDLNVYGFCYLPGGRDITDDPKIVSIAKNEKMRVYTLGGSRLSTSQDDYASSPVGIEINSALPGFNKDEDALPGLYYIPIRMIPTDLDGDGNWEVITSYAVTATGQIFRNYRNFLQSEIHSMFWDGVGMNPQWSTRTIQGGVVDIALADLNNDGKPDLVACVNVGGPLADKNTVVIGYSLDLNLEQMSVEGDFIRGAPEN